MLADDLGFLFAAVSDILSASLESPRKAPVAVHEANPGNELTALLSDGSDRVAVAVRPDFPAILANLAEGNTGFVGERQDVRVDAHRVFSLVKPPTVRDG
jgi:hypothetical protein